MLMCPLGSLQSLYPVLPPMARNWKVYIVPGVSPLTAMARELVNSPALCHGPGAPPVPMAA